MRIINPAGVLAALNQVTHSPSSNSAQPLGAAVASLIARPASFLPTVIRPSRRPSNLMVAKSSVDDAGDERVPRAADFSVDTPTSGRTGPFFQRLARLGSIGIVNGGAEGPTPTAMDLLALETGRNVAIACDDIPPNLLYDFPASVTNVVATTQVGTLAAVDTMFMLQCSTEKIMQEAKFIRPEGRVLITSGELHQVAEQVTVMHQLRPDVDIYGHAASEFVLYAPASAANPVQASYALAAILDGQSVFMVRPLQGKDADWLSHRAGISITPGTAIPAPFFEDGQVDRTALAFWLTSPKSGVKEAIEQLALLRQARPVALTEAITQAKSDAGDIDKQRRARRVPGLTLESLPGPARLAALGPTVVYGANGNIGSTLLKSLATTGQPLCGIMRKPDATFLGGFDSPRFDLIVASQIPDNFAAKTAFITASTGWPKDAAGNIIFDRSLLLAANINILVPIYQSLQKKLPLVVVISNPCSEMTYLGWLLRPDLARNLLSHAGTDVTRQMNRVNDPNDTSSYGTAGPHSPMQVNWEMRKSRTPRKPSPAPIGTTAESGGTSPAASAPRIGRIDPRIPVLGQMHQSRSRDKNSVTVPTAVAALFEAVNFIQQVPQSYARPLTADEAAQLSGLLNRHDKPIRISEGIAPALPRDANGDVRWNMLIEALDQVPFFPQKLGAAMQAMEEDRTALLLSLVNKINYRRPARDCIDSDWILAHRGAALAEAITCAKL